MFVLQQRETGKYAALVGRSGADRRWILVSSEAEAHQFPDRGQAETVAEQQYAGQGMVPLEV